jgi:hypothetical protein
LNTRSATSLSLSLHPNYYIWRKWILILATLSFFHSFFLFVFGSRMQRGRDRRPPLVLARGLVEHERLLAQVQLLKEDKEAKFDTNPL